MDRHSYRSGYYSIPAPIADVLLTSPRDEAIRVPRVKMIVDTGARMTCVPHKDLLKLGAVTSSQRSASGFSDQRYTTRKTYFINLTFEGFEFKDIEVLSVTKRFGFIGLDVLEALLICFDGKNKRWKNGL